jgi:hypothetical protein
MFIAGVDDTGEKLFSGDDIVVTAEQRTPAKHRHTPSSDTSEKFIAGVVDTGDKFLIIDTGQK